MAVSKNIIVVGAGDAGKLLAKSILGSRGVKLVGFVDDKSGFDVVGSINDLEMVCENYRVNEIVIAIPSADGGLIRKILLNLQNNKIPIKIIPREQQIIRTENVNYADARDLILDDFLGRRYDKHNLSKLRQYFNKKRILITGGAGSIGSEIVKQLLQLGVTEVLVYDNSEYLMFNLDQYLKENDYPNNYRLVIGNILNRKKLVRWISNFKPEVIIHAAAYKHVYLMQQNIDEAIINNIQGTINVVDCALKFNIPQMTFISTDKAVNPTSVMGATKRICEWYIQWAFDRNRDLKWDIVRFGNVINSNGSVLPIFERQIREIGQITVTHKDVSRFFMSIKEASRLVIESTADNISNTAHILNMGELVNIHEIALCLIRSKNLIPNTDIKILFTGLRKGEKMNEELFTPDEINQISLNHKDKVFKVKLNNSKSNLKENIHKLIRFSESGQKKSAWNEMKMLFPSLETE